MIGKLQLLFDLIFQKNFSILADYGDLKKYNYRDICIILIKWNKTLNCNNIYKDVTWQNKTSLITIRFNYQTNEFIQILTEEWKFYKLKFIR
jgi:hypothetical protein